MQAPRYLAGLLALVLVLTGQSMAIARGAGMPDGSMQICTGSGPVMIYVDDNGQPVAPPHLCPDAALGFFDTVALPPIIPLRPLGFVVDGFELVQDGPVALWTMAATARGPPRIS